MEQLIEQLDKLPFKESRKEYVTRNYGCMWNLDKWDRPGQRSESSENPEIIANRIIKKFIGKNFGKAFSHYCKLVKKYEQFYFLDQFKDPSPYYEADYIVDEQNRIQWNKNRWVKPKKDGEFIFYSYDYETAYIHRMTGECISKSEFIKRRARHSIVGKSKAYMDEFYVEIIISGYSKYFKSKKDPEYIKLNKEKIKQLKLSDKRDKKYKTEKVYSFLSRAELERKKLDELDAIKIESHGMDSSSFKGLEYHGQKRKIK